MFKVTMHGEAIRLAKALPKIGYTTVFRCQCTPLEISAIAARTVCVPMLEQRLRHNSRGKDEEEQNKMTLLKGRGKGKRKKQHEDKGMVV